MPNSLNAALTSGPVSSLDHVRTSMAKVSDPAGRASDSIGPGWVTQVIDALVRHYGSVKAMAISLRTDPSLCMREFKAGNFRLLERADGEALAAFAGAVHDQFGQLRNPRAQGKFLIAQLRSVVDQIDQLLEHLS